MNKTIAMAILAFVVAAAAEPALGARKGIQLYWQADQGQDFQQQANFKDGKACHKAGVEKTRARLVELYGEKDSYTDAAVRPAFMCHGPCRNIGGGELCDIIMYNKDQALDPGSWRAKP